MLRACLHSTVELDAAFRVSRFLRVGLEERMERRAEAREEKDLERLLAGIHKQYRRAGDIAQAYCGRQNAEEHSAGNRRRIEEKAERLEELYRIGFDDQGYSRMSAEEAADRLGIATSTVYRYVSDLRLITEDFRLTFSRTRPKRQAKPSGAVKQFARAAVLAGGMLLGEVAVVGGSAAPRTSHLPPVAAAPTAEMIESREERLRIDRQRQRMDEAVFDTYFVEGRAPRLTSAFGWRKMPRSDYHEGIDVAASPGDALLAFQSGRVVETARLHGYQAIRVKYANGYECRFVHARPLKERGETVERGEAIAIVLGGRSPHAHLDCAYVGGDEIALKEYLRRRLPVHCLLTRDIRDELSRNARGRSVSGLRAPAREELAAEYAPRSEVTREDLFEAECRHLAEHGFYEGTSVATAHTLFTEGQRLALAP